MKTTIVTMLLCAVVPALGQDETTRRPDPAALQREIATLRAHCAKLAEENKKLAEENEKLRQALKAATASSPSTSGRNRGRTAKPMSDAELDYAIEQAKKAVAKAESFLTVARNGPVTGRSYAALSGGRSKRTYETQAEKNLEIEQCQKNVNNAKARLADLEAQKAARSGL